jgi:hypothetical protein
LLAYFIDHVFGQVIIARIKPRNIFFFPEPGKLALGKATRVLLNSRYGSFQVGDTIKVIE